MIPTLPLEGGMMTSKEKNKARPLIKVTLDKERSLKLDLNAMVAFEEVTGHSLMGGTFKSEDMTPRDLRALLWACLIHEDETLTEKQVGSWISADNMAEIADRLNESFEVAMPKSEEKAEAPLAEKPPPG